MAGSRGSRVEGRRGRGSTVESRECRVLGQGFYRVQSSGSMRSDRGSGKNGRGARRKGRASSCEQKREEGRRGLLGRRGDGWRGERES
eukprot:574920-Rhodomonas_salina.2